MVKAMSKKLIYGVGINDADYAVFPKVDGVKIKCHFYEVWHSMLVRCYSENYHKKRPTYAGCAVADCWLIFSNFKEWMQTQDWQGKQLDKDILCVGNKIYSPETCAFVCRITNIFTVDSAAARGKWPIGTHFNKQSRKFQSQCCNPFSKKHEHLGYYTNADAAHSKWKERKHELACQLADLQTDQRVAKALRTRYL